MSNITSLLSCFQHFIIVIEINTVINAPNDVERNKEECMFIAQKENNDDNLLDKVVYSADEAYTFIQ
jgi:hypothetical protein